MSDYFQEMGWEPLAEGATPNQFLHMARLLRDFNMFEELGQENRLAPPASKSVVENLPEKKITVMGKSLMKILIDSNTYKRKRSIL